VFLAVQMPAFWNSDITQVTAASTSSYTLEAGVIDVLSVRIGQTAVSGAEDVEKGPVLYLLRKDYDFLLEAYPGSAPVAATITGISQATEAVVTASNSFSNGDSIVIAGVIDMTQVNGNYYTVADVSASSFKLKLNGSYVDSSGFGLYGGGGTATGAQDTGIPKYYAVSSASVSAAAPTLTNPTMEIRLGPIPNAIYPMTVDYYGKVGTDSITDGATSGGTSTNVTWLSVTAPDVLLYGALVQAYTFMKGEPGLIQMYEKQFMEGVVLLKNLGEGRQVSDVYSEGQKKAVSA